MATLGQWRRWPSGKVVFCRKGSGMRSSGRIHPLSALMAEEDIPSHRLPMEYILPLKWQDAFQDGELTEYLKYLHQWTDITVVDGSEENVFNAHHQVWSRWVRHVAPKGALQSNGKVHGVLTGLDLARHELIIIADDDVRYSLRALAEVERLLQNADLVRVQNYFDPMPWHATWDSARSLINRAFGSDYPGTLALRRSALPHGYRGDVLFENLELIRTVRARGCPYVLCQAIFSSGTS